jgi:predicted HTH domain antitoxin
MIIEYASTIDTNGKTAKNVKILLELEEISLGRAAEILKIPLVVMRKVCRVWHREKNE